MPIRLMGRDSVGDFEHDRYSTLNSAFRAMKRLNENQGRALKWWIEKPFVPPTPVRRQSVREQLARTRQWEPTQWA